MKSIFASAAAALALSVAVLPAWSAQYTYQSVEFPGAQTTAIYAVNNLRQYVGSKRDENAIHAAFWNDGKGLKLLDLSALGPIKESWAFSINTHSDIAGMYIDMDGGLHGYLRHGDDGTIEHIEFPGGHDTQGYGVNDRRTVIGVYSDDAGNPHAFERIKGEYRNIDLPGGFATTPLSVNNSNQIVGEFQPTAELVGRGFVLNPDGSFTLHNVPGAPQQSTFFISINNRKEVLGAWFDEEGAEHNVLRKQAKYKPIALPESFGADITSAQTINDFNDIVGYYVDESGLAKGWTAFSKNGGIGQ
jgi:hypothetical protein